MQALQSKIVIRRCHLTDLCDWHQPDAKLSASFFEKISNSATKMTICLFSVAPRNSAANFQIPRRGAEFRGPRNSGGPDHHHLFLKRPFPPRSAMVRRFSRYEASPHIPEHYPFRVQTKVIHIILYTLPKSSCSYPHISPLPPPHFYRLMPNHLHSYVPSAQTTSIYHATPPQPCSEPPKDSTNAHCVRDVILIKSGQVLPLW